MAQRKARLKESTLILEGSRAINTLLEHPLSYASVEKIVCTPCFNKTLLSANSAEQIEIEKALFEKLSDVEQSQGVMALVRYQPPQLEDTLTYKKLLLIENMRDPGNLGTLIRSAAGAGYDGILLYGQHVDETNPKVIRSSLGHFFTQPMYACNHAQLNKLLEQGTLISLVCDKGSPLYAYKKTAPFILAVGSEAHGLSEELLSITDEYLTIPLESTCESLNAAVAASIAMYAPNLQG